MQWYEESACTHCDVLSCYPVGRGLRGPRDEDVCKDCYQTFEYHDVDRDILDLCRVSRINLRKLADRIRFLILEER